MHEDSKKRIKKILEEAIQDGVTAGANLLIFQNGEEILYEEQGFADIEKQEPIRRNTIFRLYSMTKPITATAVMILMERGVIDLAQPVSDFLPGFLNLKVEKDGEIRTAKKEMTILHLLNMTAGITYGDNATLAGKMLSDYIMECEQRLLTNYPVTTMELADHIGTLPLAYEPDSSFSYGLCADVLGAIVEQASGMRFGTFLRKNIFEPLHMEDTDFWVPEEKRPRLASVYETTKEGKMKAYTGNHLAILNRMDHQPAYEAGGAGLVSTIDDYAKFASMLLNKGKSKGTRILSASTVDFMTTGKMTEPQQKAYRDWIGLEGFTYSHLMRIMEYPQMSSGLSRKGEYGWDGWLGCYFANFPKEKLCMLLMQQRKDSGTISMTRKIRNILLADI